MSKSIALMLCVYAVGMIIVGHIALYENRPDFEALRIIRDVMLGGACVIAIWKGAHS